MHNEFRKAMLRTANEAFQAKEISRHDLLRIRLGTLSPKVCDSLEREVTGYLADTGQLPAGGAPGAIDWANLVSVLKELLPVILEFIKALMVLF